MDSAIKNLDNDKTDPATKKMLQNVVNRKQKYDLLERKHYWTTVGSLVLGLVYILYVYHSIIQPYSYSFMDMLNAFFDHIDTLIYTCIVFGLYGYMLVLKKKTDKAEKEYHALRCEIVDRSKDLWKHESAWKDRHTIFQMMKDRYDINLYHENK